MKTLKIKFMNFWPEFDETNNFITRELKRKYILDICDKPDYVIYSIYGNDHLAYDGVKIFYTGENEVPDFNLCDYGIGFDYLDFGDRYLRYPIWLLYDNAVNLMTKKHLLIKNNLINRDFCSFIYSNPNADPMRDRILQALNTYKKVDSGGRHLNNVGEPVKDKLVFEGKHKFSIACENGSHRGYTTEKIVEAFAGCTVPIYWGDPDIENYFNPNAFINANKFNSVEEMVEYVRYIDQHDDVYLQMLASPALLDENYVNEAYEKLEIFLTNIFEQEHASAYRRDKSFWGLQYEKRMQKMSIVYEHPLRYALKFLLTQTSHTVRRVIVP